MKIYKWILGIGFLSFAATTIAQIEYVGTPWSESFFDEKTSLNDLTVNESGLSYLDSDSLLLEYNKSIENDTITHPIKVGDIRYLNVNILEKGTVYDKGDSLIVLYKISSSGAKALILAFDYFYLTEDAKVYVHYQSKYTGAYTKNNQNESGKFAIGTIPGNEVIIEWNGLKSSISKNQIQLEDIGHIFNTNSPNIAKDFGDSDDCNNNVNCEDFDAWCNQIRSVLSFRYKTTSCDDPGWYSCTGALVNNYSEDFTPYFLTAEHCVACDILWDQTLVFFNYQSPYCHNYYLTETALDEDGNEITVFDLNYGVSGSKLLAACEKTDVALVQINKKIPEQYNVYFAGYDTRKKNDMPTDKVRSIHHPRTDIKKISYGNWNNGALASQWKVCWYDGIMESGSSGAPIFEKETKRIVGVHSRGNRKLDCSDEGDFCKWIGKLLHCWHDGGIQQYLGKGIATLNLDGADPILACQDVIELDGLFRDAREYRDTKHEIIIQASNEIIIGDNSDVYFLTNPISYSDDFAHQQNPQPYFTIQAGDRIEIAPTGYIDVRINEGSIVRLKNTPCIATEDHCGFNYFEKIEEGNEQNDYNILSEEKGEVLFALYPNPTKNELTFDMNLDFDAKVSGSIYDLSGKLVKQVLDKEPWTTGQHQQKIDVTNLSSGLYIFEFCVDENCYREKVNIVR